MNRIITLGREFGSGGRELGRRLSEKLGIAYYDQEIITEIAKRTALSVEYIHRIEDSVPGRVVPDTHRKDVFQYAESRVPAEHQPLPRTAQADLGACRKV